MDYLQIKKIYNDELYHYGIKGMKWGVRRYQNKDGTLTNEGKKHYNTVDQHQLKEEPNNIKAISKKFGLNRYQYNDGRLTGEGRAFLNNKIFENEKKSEEALRKEGKIYQAKNGTWVYKDSKGKEQEYLTSTHQLSADQLSKLKKQIDAENSNTKMVSDKEKQEKQQLQQLQKDVAQKYKDAQDIFNSAKDLSKSINDAIPNHPGKKEYSKHPELTDKELQDKISRLEKEHKYSDLMNETKYIKSGSDKAREWMQTIGAVLGIAGSAAALAYTIKLTRAKSTLKNSDENNSDYLQHYGVIGMKWGRRRYQNADGSLTADGKLRYRTNQGTKEIVKNTSDYNKLTKSAQRKYVDYSTKAGAKKGFLIGMGTGAAAGVARVAINNTIGVLTSRKKPLNALREKGVNEIGRELTWGAIKGAFGGALVGTFIGGMVSKKSAKTKVAMQGKEYVDYVLSEPKNRLENEGKR